MATLPKLHNAMWPGLVGKGDEDGQEPPISLERMLDLTAARKSMGRNLRALTTSCFFRTPTRTPATTNYELLRT